MKTETYKGFKSISEDENISPGTPLCAGCGGLLALRLALKVLGKNVVIVNAAGCFTLLSVYPYTPFNSSWMYTAMACAPAGAQGIRDALDILIKKGKLKREEDLKVVVLTGDGTANDIGLQSTSAAIHRGLDFYYFCYDNEAFSNTGFQMSSATPFGSKTNTSFPGNIILREQYKRKRTCLRYGDRTSHLIWLQFRHRILSTSQTNSKKHLTTKVLNFSLRFPLVLRGGPLVLQNQLMLQNLQYKQVFCH